jgi:hypothetical protein
MKRIVFSVFSALVLCLTFIAVSSVKADDMASMPGMSMGAPKATTAKKVVKPAAKKAAKPVAKKAHVAKKPIAKAKPVAKNAQVAAKFECQKCHMQYSAADAKKYKFVDPMDGGKLVPVKK